MGLVCPRKTEVIVREKSEKPQDVAKDKVVLARQVYIKASDIEQSGMTRGCPRCDHQLKSARTAHARALSGMQGENHWGDREDSSR